MYSDENELSFLLKEHKMKMMSGKGKGSLKIPCQNQKYLDCLCSINMDSFRNKYS